MNAHQRRINKRMITRLYGKHYNELMQRLFNIELKIAYRIASDMTDKEVDNIFYEMFGW